MSWIPKSTARAGRSSANSSCGLVEHVRLEDVQEEDHEGLSLHCPCDDDYDVVVAVGDGGDCDEGVDDGGDDGGAAGGGDGEW